jgi:hypothetical protein
MKATMAMAWKMEGIAFEIRLRTAGRGILAAKITDEGHSSTISQSQVGRFYMYIIAGQSPERWNDR